MDQLKFKDLVELFEELKKQYTVQEILEMPIYIGTDDELNGVHCAWFGQKIDVNNEDDEGFIELINEDCHNHQIKDKAILIS